MHGLADYLFEAPLNAEQVRLAINDNIRVGLAGQKVLLGHGNHGFTVLPKDEFDGPLAFHNVPDLTAVKADRVRSIGEREAGNTLALPFLPPSSGGERLAAG